MRRYLWIAAAIFVFQLVEQYVLSPGEMPRRPGPAAPEAPPLPPAEPDAPPGTPLPDPTETDPTFIIEAGDPVNSTGSAFAIAPGLWMTARHVTFGCRALGILTGPRDALRAERVVEHPRADVAILRTDRTGPAVAVERDGGALALGDVGYHFGFPDARPGAARSELLGRRRMQVTGGRSGVTPVLAWAETDRQPDFATLSGISGGPVLDARGRAVGVTVASSVRRGRIFTAAPAVMDEALREGRVRPAEAAGTGLDPARLGAESYPAYGEGLRAQFSIGQVICRVD